MIGPRAVLIKGGHGKDREAEDLLFDGSTFQTHSAPRFDTPHTHGTGCTLSAAIATFLAKGLDLAAAVEEAKRFIEAQQGNARFRGRNIATVVEKAGTFYEAEEYHQNYHAKHGGSCSIGSAE